MEGQFYIIIKMSTLKKKEPLKVFRITLLGRAEAGKTTVCTQFIANGYSTRYEHTESPHMYYREMKPKDLFRLLCK